MVWNTILFKLKGFIMTLKKEQELLTSHQVDSLGCIGEMVSIHKEVFMELPPTDLAILAHKIAINVDEASILTTLQNEVERVKEESHEN
jgi:hypothetical protein